MFSYKLEFQSLSVKVNLLWKIRRQNTIKTTKGAFTLANFACDFALSLHALLQIKKFSFLNMQA